MNVNRVGNASQTMSLSKVFLDIGSLSRVLLCGHWGNAREAVNGGHEKEFARLIESRRQRSALWSAFFILI